MSGARGGVSGAISTATTPGGGTGSGGRAEGALSPSPVQQVLPPLPPWEMQLGKVLSCCELPWGTFQLQGGCWVYLCVFECVLVSLARDTFREGRGTCEGKSPGQ